VPPKRHAAEAILLDWDGTLLNSYAADSRAYLKMFRALGIPWGLSDLEKHYSPNWHKVYRAARVPKHKWEEADHLWYEAYKNESPKLLTGARATIKLLAKNFTLGIVTSGNRERVSQQLRDFRLEEYFAVQVCAEDATHRKPHPAPLKLALAKLNLKPESCIYVGDAPEDVEMARRARVRVFGVHGPFPTAERLRAAKPDQMLKSIADLPNRINPMPTVL
jgi:HAD superfamily hydrolase (TIGR01549 family)